MNYKAACLKKAQVKAKFCLKCDKIGQITILKDFSCLQYQIFHWFSATANFLTRSI
ncbi:hypothetical protein OfM1_10150 [Lactovum odontotermitis]